ncbi:N-acetyltransferase family protein [Dactylosporangium sp. CS-033363]|uniref:GNAT family N-acetyltransferase n=1 Tax=Dactylosporangium sp. CS-033363 TaxID=3239935 RepID=UPI003D8D628B
MIFRTATRRDLPAIVALLADDVLGRARDSAGVDAVYERAFQQIDADPRNELIVVEEHDDVIACLQVTYIPGLSRHGTERALVESVRVRADQRNKGVGVALMHWVIDRARARGCGLVQLTTDKARADAYRFYLRLGFTPSHEGLKLPL